MTVEAWTPPTAIILATAGPHAIPFPYAAGAVRAFIDNLGVVTELTLTADYTVAPLTAAVSGNLTLTAPTYAANIGAKLYITRATTEEQGWLGVQGAREKGLEAQLDRMVQRIQELGQGSFNGVRSLAGALKPMVPVPGRLIIFDAAGSPTNGPNATDIAGAQANAASAAADRVLAQAAQVAAAASAASLTYATLAEAQAGVITAKGMNPLTTKGAIDAFAPYPRLEPLLNGDFAVAQDGGGNTNNVNSFRTKTNFDVWYITAFLLGTMFAAQVKNTSLIGHLRPKFVSQIQTTGQSGVAAFGFKDQRIEDVRTYAGQTVTFFGWAFRATPGNVAISLVQNFGTGGAPSAPVTVNATALIAVGAGITAWKYTVVVPSIVGKTIGTNENSYLEVRYWQSAGSNFNIETLSLGVANTTVTWANLHSRVGDLPLSAINSYQPPDPTVEFQRCQRYLQFVTVGSVGNMYFGSGNALAHNFASNLFVKMYRMPDATTGSPFTFTNCSTPNYAPTQDSIAMRVDVTVAGAYRAIGGSIRLDAGIV